MSQAPPPRCAHFFNIIHEVDPVSYRMEPMLGGVYDNGTMGTGLLPDHLSLRHASVSEIILAIDRSASGRVDVEIKPSMRHELAGSLAARGAHGVYWGSSDMMLFVLARLCEPVARTVRRYPRGQLPVLHRPFTPLTVDQLVSHCGLVLCRLPVTGTWCVTRAILLEGGMLYLIHHTNADENPSCELLVSISLSSDCALNVLSTSRSFQLVCATSSGRTTHTFHAETVIEFNGWLEAARQCAFNGLATQEPAESAGERWFGSIHTGCLQWSFNDEPPKTVWCAMHAGSLDIYKEMPFYADSIPVKVCECTLECSPATCIVRLTRTSGSSVEWRVTDPAELEAWALAVRHFGGSPRQLPESEQATGMALKVEGHRILSNEQGEPFAAFVLCVLWEGSLHVTLRRFSEFEALVVSIRVHSPQLVVGMNLPSTRLFRRLEQSYLLQKGAALELWCNQLLQRLEQGMLTDRVSIPAVEAARRFFCPAAGEDCHDAQVESQITLYHEQHID